MINTKNKRGFTLVETIIYISLFSIILTCGLIACYQIISSSDLLNQTTRTEEEGNFVLRKLTWVFSSLDSTIPPTISGGSCSQNISISKTNSVNPIRIRMNSSGGKNYIEIQDDGVNYYPITTSSASTTCLEFTIISGNPYGIIATSTINGKDFVLRKYARI